MLASSSLNPALIVVPAVLLALVAFVAVRRTKSSESSSGSRDAGVSTTERLSEAKVTEVE